MVFPPRSEARLPGRFEEFAALRDDRLDLAWGAALLAKDAHPGLDVGALVASFDGLAAPLRSRGLDAMTPEGQVEALAAFVYGELGFQGNEADYYDPRNSLLDHVLARRRGIPITLALVYSEIARRVGVEARGVSFPGHFLLRVEGSRGKPLVVDPFYGGQVLTRAALTGRLRRALGAPATSIEAHLEVAPVRAVLVRIALNLKHAYLARGDLARALLATDRVVSLDPALAAALLERASLAERLGAYEAARSDLRRYAELFPEKAEAAGARARLEELEARRTPAAHLH